MNELMIFEGHEVEVIELNGQVLFNANNVAEILDIKNVRDNISKMNEKQVFKLSNSDVANTDIRKLNNAGENFLTESGVYKLVFKSHKPNAEEFTDWITDDVLPSIRKTGGYLLGEETMSEDELLSQALLVAQRKIEEKSKKIVSLETEVEIKNQIIGELKPKADYTSMILNNRGLVTITQIAKDYGKSGSEMNKILHAMGVQYKQSEQWLLYACYQDKGYTHSKTVVITRKDGTPDTKLNTKWTQKGRLFLYELLKKNGYLPMIELQQSA